MRSSISFRTSSPAASLSMRAYNEFQLGRNSAAWFFGMCVAAAWVLFSTAHSFANL